MAEEQQFLNSLDEFMKLADLYTDRLHQLAVENAAEKKQPEKELVLWTGIAGIQHHVDIDSRKGKKYLKSLTPGTLLTLRREPDNDYDPWAIAVDAPDGKMLGYITRFKNETIARMMDHGHLFEARVEEQKKLVTKAPLKTVTEQFILPFSVWLVK